MNWSIPIRKAMTGLIYWILAPMLALVLACALFDQRALVNPDLWGGFLKFCVFLWSLRQIIRFALFFARRPKHYHG